MDNFQIAIYPETCGFVNNQWWHKTLKQNFDSPIEALILAESILLALKNEQDCPCGECTLLNPSTVEHQLHLFEVSKDEEEIHLD